MSLIETMLRKAFARGFVPPFRGTLPENCRRFSFRGDGYKAMPPEQNGQFWIESARQCAGPMTALLDDLVRYVHVIGATQVLKSMVGDAWVPYVMEHLGGAMLVLFEDDPKADFFCNMRLMETLKHHPVLKQMIATVVKEEGRHKVTGTKIKTPIGQLFVGGMNDGNCSTLSWQNVWISEAWQHGNDGLLFKAFKRTDRYAETCKVLNESQAAMAGTDLHNAVKQAHPVPLTWKCPACDGVQTWEWQHWSHKRPDDFVPRSRKAPSMVNIGGQMALVETDIPQPGSFAGMRWQRLGVDEAEDTRSIEEKARAAHWECIWCGHHIHDTRAERKALTETYEQDYRIKLDSGQYIAPRQVWFTIPFESAWDNRFEKTVANYLVAKNEKQAGNDIPLQDWFMAERAIFYDERMSQTRIASVTLTVDPLTAIPNESFRMMEVDCQKDIQLSAAKGTDMTGHFWCSAWAVDNDGNMVQLWRGYATSWEEWIAKYKELKIPTQNVDVDGGFKPDEVKAMAAKHAAVACGKCSQEYIEAKDETTGKSRMKPRCKCGAGAIYSTWTMLRGDNVRSFAWEDGTRREWSRAEVEFAEVQMPDGRMQSRAVNVIRWSNFRIKNRLQMLLNQMPGQPKMTVLPVDSPLLSDKTRQMEQGDCTWDNQMNSEILGEERKQPKWIAVHKQNHYRDTVCQGIVRMLRAGKLGQVATDDAAQEA